MNAHAIPVPYVTAPDLFTWARETYEGLQNIAVWSLIFATPVIVPVLAVIGFGCLVGLV